MKYAFRKIHIDEDAYEIRHNGSPIDVEPRVFDFIVYLIRHRDRMVTKVELLEQVWHGLAVGESAIVRCASMARRIVGDSCAIRTVHARGYQWIGRVRGETRDGEAASEHRLDTRAVIAREDAVQVGRRRMQGKPSE